MHHCGRFQPVAFSRREMLRTCACGFGSLALGGLTAETLAKAGQLVTTGGGLHHAATAKNIIFLYMDGGVSQVDSFDPKPRLQALHGQPFPMHKERTQFNENGLTLGSPWKFNRHGECGLTVSELFPQVATCADDLCVVRSMTSKFSEHTNANYFLHTGHGMAGRPSMGAWMSYGLGCESENLPGFVVLNGGLTPPGGQDCFSSGFLPVVHQGSRFRPDSTGLDCVTAGLGLDRQRRMLEMSHALDEGFAARTEHADAVEASIRNQELAFRMQASVPDLMELAGESKATHALYGTDSTYAPTAIFARECLLARRMVERGVRFIELTCPAIDGNDRWDQHDGLKKGHEENALAVDRPIAGLLKDLKSRGMLDETLVLWAGEFGRTPFAQGTDGRDHNPFGYTVWMAGGGVKPGFAYGQTDEFGYKAVEHPLEMYDLHATIMHLMGVDHRRLTYNFGGRDMRLTDVHGHVVTDLLV
ncbi:MAG: DUF1501 domain-containing protein [Phycisphaerales bacterium]|nr:DUF1501 domain-containing protein [Phycisphaerales bacterium]